MTTFDRLMEPVLPILQEIEQGRVPHFNETYSWPLFVRVLVYHFTGSSGLAVNTTTSRGGCSPRTEPTIAFEIKREPLKQPPDIAQSVAPPFEHLEFVV